MGVLINIFKLPELRRRVLFTLAMLAVYRFGIFVAVPGVDRNVMAKIVSSGTGGVLGGADRLPLVPGHVERAGQLRRRRIGVDGHELHDQSAFR